MSDLVARIRAQIDETERLALAAAGQHGQSWTTSDLGAWLSSEHGHVMIGEEYSPGQEVIDHIARHDPARVLATVAAHRKILDRHAEYEGRCTYCVEYCNGGRDENICTAGNTPWPCPDALALAAAYGIDTQEQR